MRTKIKLIVLTLIFSTSIAAKPCSANDNIDKVLYEARKLVLEAHGEAVISFGGLLQAGESWEPQDRAKLAQIALKVQRVRDSLGALIPQDALRNPLSRIIPIPGSRTEIEVREKTDVRGPKNGSITREIIAQKSSGDVGVVISGPIFTENTLWVLVRFQEVNQKNKEPDEVGWVPVEKVRLVSKMSPAELARACHIYADATMIYGLTTMRYIEAGGEIVGKTGKEVADTFRKAYEAYTCALSALSMKESGDELGGKKVSLREEIIRKNFISLEKADKQAKRAGETMISDETELSIADELLALRTEEGKPKSRTELVIPAPQEEGDPGDKFTPGEQGGI